MSERKLVWSLTDQGIKVQFPDEKQSLISSIFKKNNVRSFEGLSENDRQLLFAIGDLRAWGDEVPGDVKIEPTKITISHDASAHLSSQAAEALGLPPLVDMTLKTDVSGVLGSHGFKLSYEWLRRGRQEHPTRVGSILKTSDGPRRLPLWMKRTIDLADNFDPKQPLEAHWKALAEFRRAIEPEDQFFDTADAQQKSLSSSMTDFLQNLEVQVADQFSISPDANIGQFEVIPYSSKNLSDMTLDEGMASESHSELQGEALATFQNGLHNVGAKPAYKTGSNSYLVIEASAAPVLEEMVRVQRSSREERRSFISNPRVYLNAAVSRHLENRGAFEGLDDLSQQEMIDGIAGSGLVETREYSDRVTGVIIYEKPLSAIAEGETTWLPEAFPNEIADAIRDMSDDEIFELRNRVSELLEEGRPATVEILGTSIEVNQRQLAALEGEVEKRTPKDQEELADANLEQSTGPLILETVDNYEDLAWQAKLSPRSTNVELTIPTTVSTRLHSHQKESFDWTVDAWKSGLPGILNADEPGLGKTLQTISFLSWLKEHMKDDSATKRGPVMIVAPTSLLRNWEQEVEMHVKDGAFGTLIPLYGNALSSQKNRNSHGTETKTGLPQLDLDWLHEAVKEGRAHKFWMLTTYTTLTNYQHSLGKVAFSALVMDEIQNIKNRNTLASKAIEAVNADFRIGLTGTPIENSAMDLWTIMDRIAPGSLGSGAQFQKTFAKPDADNMSKLHAKIFQPFDGLPSLGLRRLKEDVARDLPVKSRFLHPRLMPQEQIDLYDLAQGKLSKGGAGAALKALHHIRSVSVHPSVNEVTEPEAFVAKSARLQAVMHVIEKIRLKRERVLVFIEHREMQFRFAEIIRCLYGLEKIDVINGNTPIVRRQEIVNNFQRHLERDDGFDLLILGPKAAGTGLTLTAATHVIHLSRWWNPAVEEQCNDRVHRIGQSRPVSVHIPMAIHPDLGTQSFDCLLQSLMQRKRKLAEQALWPMGDTAQDVSGLVRDLTNQSAREKPSAVREIMYELFERDGLGQPEPTSTEAFRLP